MLVQKTFEKENLDITSASVHRLTFLKLDVHNLLTNFTCFHKCVKIVLRIHKVAKFLKKVIC